jgi:methylmalonyl-CoA mutase cobalamin-binding domain/chain
MSELSDAIINFDEERAINALKEKKALPDILSEVSSALEIVGKKYESHEYFLAELMMCGEVAKKVVQELRPLIEKERERMLGKIVFGTVLGDIHDIGKTIVSSFLIGAGFQVIDLGVEVPAEKFVSVVRETDADIVAMSALLSTTIPYMEVVIKELKKAGLREKVKVIVGGRPVTPEFARKIGADATAVNPSDAVEICRGWVG